MPRKLNGRAEKSALHRAASAVKRLFTRGSEESDTPPAETPVRHRQTKTARPQAAKATRRESDIPLDVLDRSYTPPVTSSKASFRSDGEDHQLDQEFAFGRADNDWNDEDRYTNKSGDPRIGTHRRTYEPDEARVESK